MDSHAQKSSVKIMIGKLFPSEKLALVLLPKRNLWTSAKTNRSRSMPSEMWLQISRAWRRIKTFNLFFLGQNLSPETSLNLQIIFSESSLNSIRTLAIHPRPQMCSSCGPTFLITPWIPFYAITRRYPDAILRPNHVISFHNFQPRKIFCSTSFHSHPKHNLFLPRRIICAERLWNLSRNYLWYLVHSVFTLT